MIQWVKALATKVDDLSSNTRTHMEFLQVVLWPQLVLCDTWTHTDTDTYTQRETDRHTSKNEYNVIKSKQKRNRGKKIQI